MGLYENLSVAYAALNMYGKALENIDGAIAMQQLMTNKTREELLYAKKRELGQNHSAGKDQV